MRPRITRSLFAFVLLTAIFAGACATAIAPVKLAAQAQPKPAEAQPEQPKPAVPGGFEDLRPAGDDAWFAPLPVEGLHQGARPAAFCKAVLIDIPFEDSGNDNPVEDLPESARVAAQGLRLALEQRLDYMPGVYQYLPQIDANDYLGRVKRFQAALRFGDARGLAVGAKSKSLEAVCARFGAGAVFATVYTRGNEQEAPRASVVRYMRGVGVAAVASLELTKPSKQTLVTALGAATESLCANLAMSLGETPAPLPTAVVPTIAVDDSALRLFVQVRALMEQGELTQAWVKYEDLKQRDPNNGRAALYAMEIFRGFADKQTEPAERDKYLDKVISTGRDGLKVAPNDVILRGKLCRLVSIWFKRDAWCLEGIKQGLGVQPANAHLLDWHVTIEHALDRAKQAQWLESTALPLLPDGTGAYLIGTAYYSGGQFSKAVEWYRRAVALAPQEHEYSFSLGLVATYLGEQLQKTMPAADATIDAFATASEALIAAQRIDPTMMGWPYEYHVRAGTRSFKHLPANPDDLERLMLSQAVVNGLQPTSKTGEWDKLVAPVIVQQRRLLRQAAKEAKADGPDYEVWLMARLQFALVDKDQADIVATLKLMRRNGHRSALYVAVYDQFKALVD